MLRLRNHSNRRATVKGTWRVGDTKLIVRLYRRLGPGERVEDSRFLTIEGVHHPPLHLLSCRAV